MSDKYLGLDEIQQGLIMECMNEHADLLQQMATPPPEPEGDPALTTTDAAQKSEDELMSMEPPQNPAGDSLQAQIDNGPNMAPPAGPEEGM